jgi:hypothetical protein
MDEKNATSLWQLAWGLTGYQIIVMALSHQVINYFR